MSKSPTVPGIVPTDKPCRRREARRVRKTSEACARHFGERHGVDLPTPPRRGYRPHLFAEEDRE